MINLFDYCFIEANATFKFILLKNLKLPKNCNISIGNYTILILKNGKERTQHFVKKSKEERLQHL